MARRHYADRYLQFWDELWSLAIPSVIDLDTLGGTNPKTFDPQDSSNVNFRWLAEAKRKIEVKNNNFFEPASPWSPSGRPTTILHGAMTLSLLRRG